MSASNFNFYDPNKVTTSHKRCLPHLEQTNVCYFITMMAADAFPKEAKENWELKRKIWCRNHGFSTTASREEIYKNCNQRLKQNFIRSMSSAYQRSLDKGSGACVLKIPEIAQIVESAMLFHQGKTCDLADRVVMPNHVHFLIQPYPTATLKEILKSIRRYSAREINRKLNQTGRFWSQEPFDHIVRSQRYFNRYQAYIRANPKRAKLRSGEYLLVEA
ncbi:transposase [Kiritimatiellaeota bacterium B1221]|nr:transposase [Kiritimatiellaeota bacterium B1221]